MPSSFAVDCSGEGHPMLLLPGAACDASLWEETARLLRPHYALSAVTLAGFGGVPPIEAPLLHTARGELADYLRALKRRCVVVGHSLGGFLALALAIDAPDRVAAVVAVDGVLSLKHLLRGQGAPASLSSMDRASFESWLESALGEMARDPLPDFRRLARACDRDALDRAMHELWESDLRPRARDITAPVLLVLPGESSLRERAEAQLRSIRHLEVQVIEGARHMIMLDAPAALANAVHRFADAVLAPG